MTQGQTNGYVDTHQVPDSQHLTASHLLLPRSRSNHTVQWKDILGFFDNKFSIMKAGQSIWFSIFGMKGKREIC